MEIWVQYNGNRCHLIYEKNIITINNAILKLNRNVKLKYKFYNGIIKGFFINENYIQFNDPKDAKTWHDLIYSIFIRAGSTDPNEVIP
jgi:hypothetical protein